MPYVKGEMLSKLSSVASEAPTLVPASTSLRSAVISMVPRAILVGTPRAWKKDVFPGSIPLRAVSEVQCCGAVLLRVTSRHVNIVGRDGTGTSGRGDTVGKDLVADLLEVAVGEDEANVACAC
jgi:hypothetical protein